MKAIADAFFAKSTIARTAGAEAILNELSTPEAVSGMIAMSRLGLPSLTAVVQELEARFGDDPDFPLNKSGADKNATNRQNVGRMIKYVMRQFGYTPIPAEQADRTRLRDFANSAYFSTGAVYERTLMNPKYRLEARIVDADGQPVEE